MKEQNTAGFERGAFCSQELKRIARRESPEYQPTFHEQIERLTAQRDELLAALKACFDVMERTHGSTIPIHLGGYCEEQDWSTSYRLASAAIKHAEEGK